MDNDDRYRCPENNYGGRKTNEQGMTLNPYFTDLQRSTAQWSTLNKSDISGRYPNRPKTSMGDLLFGGGGGGGSNKKTTVIGGNGLSDDPFEDLRNRWSFHNNGKVSPNVYGHSTYQNDFNPPPPSLPHHFGAESMRLASFVPPRNNMYRPMANDHLQNSNDWIPKRPLECTSSRYPCRQPHSNISTVNMDQGFGSYLSETREQFDRPSHQLFWDSVYELPSGYSTAVKSGFWDPDPPTCDLYDRSRVVTPPQRYNPWPRLLIGHEAMLRREYRPSNNIEYTESTIIGPTSREAQMYIF